MASATAAECAAKQPLLAAIKVPAESLTTTPEKPEFVPCSQLEKDGWDIDFLKPFISASEFVAIQETQIGVPCLDDRLVWPFDRRGLYTVKSGYHCVHAKREQRVNFGSSSSVTVPGKLWKAIWNLNTPRSFVFSCGRRFITRWQRWRAFLGGWWRHLLCVLFAKSTRRPLNIYFCSARGLR
ncbi:hypothetical protein FF1_037183 [Malus domestica]